MAETRVIADRIFPGEGVAADVVRIAAANILLVLCAHIAIPLPWTPVPITGQTFGVLLVAILLGARRAAVAVVMYLLEGMAGLPVFATVGAPGPARFFGPTAGYLMAYPPAAFVTGCLAEYSERISFLPLGTLRRAGALLAGELIIFVGGCGWLAAGMRYGWGQAIRMGAWPFLPGEIIKAALILAIVRGVELARRPH